MAGEKSCPVGKRVLPHVERQAEKKMAAYEDAYLSKSPTGASIKDEDVEVNLSEVYFLIMHFLASGPCSRATGQLWNELLQHKLLPRRYHAWYSRNGLPSGDENDDGNSFPLSYIQVLERNPEIEKDHLVKLLKQQLVASRRVAADTEASYCRILTAADVPTLLGEGSFSLLDAKPIEAKNSQLLSELRWPHGLSSQVRGLALREISGGFSKHHRAPSIRAASYTILKPHILVDKIQIIKKIRGHRNAVYCAIFDRTGQHIITGSDDRLVKFWSTETGFCLRSCRGHEGDITELSVSHGNSLVASASNDCTIRVWRLPDGIPVSVLRGHTGAVTAIAFRPRQSCEHHLLSSSDDGTCRIWDARDSSVKPRVYMPNPEAISLSAKSVATTQPVQQQPGLQISCCAFNADGSIFVTGSSDKFARVWDARKWNDEITGKPNYEMDVLKGHENAVNYVQFCGCAGPVKPNVFEGSREDGTTKFKNAWPTRDSIVTCSRDGSAIIWICKSRKKIARYSHWSKAYHLRVPPPPMPPHPPRVGGPRQRLLPTPRGVNMIVWSLDNRFVLAAIMDCRICVWNAIDGSLVHSLTGHTKSTFVVDVHPFNPRIAMSAGYDGRVIIWDIWEGQPVRVYETGEFQIVDGCFSPDGTSIVVSDEVGQFYLLTTGQGQSQKDAKFDQFFLGDFRPLVRDLQGNVLDQETQLPPHQRNIKDLLCDANMIPYQEPYQSMYQQRRLGALGVDWQPLQLNLAVGMDDLNYAAFRETPIVSHPNIPGSSIETADYSSRRWVEQPVDVDEEVDWEQDLTRLTDDSGSDYSASEEILSFLEEIEEDEATASSSEGLGQSDTDGDDHASAQELRLRRSNRYKRKAEGHSHDHDERKIRKLPNNQVIDSSNKLRLDKTKQGQSAFSKTSTKIASARQLGRPKRAAAANALQLFTSKQLNDDGEDDDASSSHQDTSLYNDEEDAESDAQVQSSDKNDERNTCPEIDEGVETNNMEEISLINGQKGLKVDNLAETKEEGQQVCEVLTKAGDKATAVSEDGSSRAHETSFRDREGDEYFHYNEIYDGTKGSLTGMVPGELMTSASNESLQQEEPGRRSKSQRRLVVKVSKKVNDMVAHENKAEREDPVTSRTNRPLVDHLDLSKEQHKRRFRRLIDKAPVSSRHSPENLDDLSVTSDDENCSGVKHGTLPIQDNDDSLPPDEFGWPRKRYKEKGQSGYDVVPKYAERSEEAASSEPSGATPTSFSGMYHSPTNSGSTFEKAVGEAFPGAEEDSSNHAMDIDNGGIDWSGNSELQQDRVDSFERQADAVLCHRQMSSPELSGKFPILSTHSPSSENPSEGQYGRPRPRSCLESEIHQGDMNMHAVCSRRIGSNHGKVKLGHEEQCQDVSEAVNPARATISFRARKERENIAGEHDKVVFFPLSKEEDFRVGASQSMSDLNYFREVESEERNAFRDGSGDAVPTGPEHTDESEPSLIGNHIDCESCHDDDASWSQSESERTLCEIGSANILSPKPDEDSTGTEEVQPMWPSMMDNVKAIRVKKGNRGKRAAVKKETEMCDEERKPQRLGVWTRKAAAFSHNQDENVEDHNLSITNRCAHESESYGRSCRGIGQWQAQSPTTIKEKKLRISSRNRKEMAGTLHSDQARQLNMSMMVPDRVARTRKSLAWLLQSEMEETRYVPQYGDKVVYLRQGHAEYLDTYHVSEPGPWTTYGADLSDTEICQVVGLEYTILPASGETCCKYTLEFLASSSLLQGETFWLRLPELINFPDFIIEKTRYDASIERRWTTRDKCNVWWRSQNGQGGGWWQGRVVAVKPKSMDFPESPWERFLVQYKSDPNKPYRHSPWELFDPTDAKWEQPHIENGMKERLLMELESAANEPEDAYGFRKFRAAAGKADFLNRLPLPLTLDVLIQRLKKDYYHSAQAFYFDVQLLASNAQRLCGTLHPMTQGLQSFAKELHTEIFSESSFHIQ